MTEHDNVILVDENDQALGEAKKLAAHQQGLLHRAFSVFILRENNNDTEVLLQQRQHSKYHCGGLWTNTCCSHPRPGETTAAAASRRLQEEMGLNIALNEIGSFCYRAEFDNGLTEHELDYVFVGYYQDEKIQSNPSEVADYRWMSFKELETELNKNSQHYTPWLSPALELVVRHSREGGNPVQ